MSVAEHLSARRAGLIDEAAQLREDIGRAESRLAGLRDRLAAVEEMAVECQVAANILRDHDLRVWREDGDVHVSIDPPKSEVSA